MNAYQKGVLNFMKKVTEKSSRLFWGQIGLSLLFMALYGAGMPFGLFHISIGNEDMTFVANMAFISAVTVIGFPAVFKGWDFGLHKKGIVSGIVKYGTGMLIDGMIIVAGICYTAMPFDKTPGVWSVIVECILFFFSVGFIEELLLRGCIFKAILLKLGDNKKGVILSVLVSSAIFSLMHIVGAPDDRRIFIMKLIWTFCGGITFAILYYVTNNLWCGIILHGLVDIADMPVMFSSKDAYSLTADSALLSSIVMLVVTFCFCRKEIAHLFKQTGRED